MNHPRSQVQQANWAEANVDDLSALREIVALPELGYQDIGQQQQLITTLARWPLLVEFSLLTEPKS